MMLKVILLGTRGSIAISGKSFIEYGGNTQCVIVKSDNEAIILDAGTGILNANKHIENEDISILLSHYHMDHIAGLIMFQPFSKKDKKISIFAPEYNGKQCYEVLKDIFCPPLWPVFFDAISSTIEYNTISANKTFNIGSFEVKTQDLCHPNGSLGYRLSKQGKSIVYLFDHEEDISDKDIFSFIQNADILICDAPYTKNNYSKFRGFGHSTVEKMIEIATQAKVKKIVVSHHALDNTDDKMKILQAAYSQVFYAKEGDVFEL